MNIFDIYLDKILKIVKDLNKKTSVQLPQKLNSINVDIPPEKFDADISSNVAMVVGKLNKTNPMEFGKITVPEDNTKDLLISAGKSKGAKNYSRMLEKAQEYQKKLSEMTPEKREEKEWKEVFATAHGDKSTNNIKALKSKMKKKEKSKERSTKRWKQIKQGEEKSQKERQEKREDNLRKRKRSADPIVLDSTGANSSNLLQGVKSGVKTHVLNENDKASLSKAAKSGNENGKKKNRPGFEGRKQDFLNNNKKQKTK